MAKSKRYEKNLSKIQSMVDGTYGGKIQSGYTPENIHANRKLGEKWTDADGVEWEQKEGYRSKVSKMASRGIADTCKKCKKLVLKQIDKDTYNRMGKCYHCQMNFELDLQFMRIGERGNKWQFWVKLQELRRWDSIDREIEQYIEARHEENKKNPYDMSVANALANGEIETTMKVNKQMTTN